MAYQVCVIDYVLGLTLDPLISVPFFLFFFRAGTISNPYHPQTILLQNLIGGYGIGHIQKVQTP